MPNYLLPPSLPPALLCPALPARPLPQELIAWNFQGKLLVTGTPLQNNVRELWALLHFLHPERFPNR